MLSTLLYVHKMTVMSGTHRDLLFWSRSRCFEWKNHRRGLGTIESCNSDAKYALVLAQNDRSGLGPIKTCYSLPEVAVLHVKFTGGSGTHRDL